MRRTALVSVLLMTLGLGLCCATAGPGANRTDPTTTRPATQTSTARARTTTSTASTTSAPTTQARLRRAVEINRQLDGLFKQKKYEECMPLLEEQLRLNADDFGASYNIACVHARMNRGEEALKALEKSIELGYSDFRHMEHDPDLDSIRTVPAYKGFLARNEEIQRTRAAKMEDAMRKQFGAGYIYKIDHEDKLIFATNTDQHTLDDMRTHLIAQAQAMWADLFCTRFEQYVTVVVPTLETSAKMMAPAIGGYYNHGTRVLVCKQVGMVLTHEFTHALHAADQDGHDQQHPIWVLEGLATLYESSQIKDGHIVPQHNMRLNQIKNIVAGKRSIPWADFFKLDQPKYIQQARICYPEGRYIMMYLYEKGLLKTWYDAYVADFESDKTGVKAMEKVFSGKKLAAIEADWKKWIDGLKALPTSIAANHAYMGVKTAGDIDGLRVISTVPGSGADKAGLKAGDVITHVNSERVVDQGDLVQLVDEHQVGGKLEVEYRRDTKYAKVMVELQAMPAALAATVPAPRTQPSTSSRPTSRPASASAPAPRPVTRPAATAPDAPSTTSAPAEPGPTGRSMRRPALRMPATQPATAR